MVPAMPARAQGVKRAFSLKALRFQGFGRLERAAAYVSFLPERRCDNCCFLESFESFSLSSCFLQHEAHHGFCEMLQEFRIPGTSEPPNLKAIDSSSRVSVSRPVAVCERIIAHDTESVRRFVLPQVSMNASAPSRCQRNSACRKKA